MLRLDDARVLLSSARRIRQYDRLARNGELIISVREEGDEIVLAERFREVRLPVDTPVHVWRLGA